MNPIGDRIVGRLRSTFPDMSQAELARSVGMDPSALSRAVNGSRGLAGREVVALARELKVSTDWLLLGEEPFPVKIAARHDWAIGGYSASVGDEATAGIIQGVVTSYEQAENLVDPPVCRAVPRDPIEARRVLQENFGVGWVRDFASAVEQTFGVDVIKLRMPAQAGVSLKVPNATVIVVPNDAFWGRQNFTIAHELWHIAHDDFTDLAEGVESAGESSANAYAAELLMPSSVLEQVDWAHVSDVDLAQWVWDHGVSLDALGRRLSHLGLAQPPQTSSLMSLLRRHIRGANVFDDPVTNRLRDAAARRFPTRLLASHEELGTHTSTLSWMLDAPYNFDTDTQARPGRTPASLTALFRPVSA
ncbi:helix-turn-helix domain-containing protein [Microbacterium sp. NPDC090007]|uniref:helix-turn-helix domain-containing protein n=1 Tax=Microbacterium sp. NPDC090007 TaxID=3364204 RepID=UPI00382423FD